MSKANICPNASALNDELDLRLDNIEILSCNRTARDQASAHVGADAGVSQLVRAALELCRPDAPEVTASATRDTLGEHEMTTMATQALVQLGYPRPVATRAVSAATVHVDSRDDLATLIKEALRRTSA